MNPADAPWDDSISLASAFADRPYHFEYTNLHNHRLALIRRVDLWHQIAYAATFAVWGLTLNAPAIREDPTRVSLGLVFAALFVLFAMLYGKRLDNGVVQLYPRLITLERILDYHFWREYLKALGPVECCLIRRCERLPATTTTELFNAIKREFRDEEFPLRNRYLFRLLIVDVALLVVSLSVPLYFIAVWLARVLLGS